MQPTATRVWRKTLRTEAKGTPKRHLRIVKTEQPQFRPIKEHNMDPDIALANAREAAAQFNSLERSWPVDSADVIAAAAEAIEHYQALDEWISKGGFLPNAWQYRRDMNERPL
jgi:transposase-like protein